ncbi:MAG: hypothetical protein ACP5R5_00655 [Armatimonadota bacterium]
MSELVRYLTPPEAAESVTAYASELGITEFAAVRNLDYVFSPWELYPLAPRVEGDLDWIVAFAVDMDGTSTTTEPLALHALEYMVRRFTDRMAREDWPGLDPEKDYPYVIGNSNFRHTEFLVERYRDDLSLDALRSAFFESLLWTLANMEDPRRRDDVRATAIMCGVGAVLEDPQFLALAGSGDVDEESLPFRVEPFVRRYGARFRCRTLSEIVSAALDIYYMRYHSILRKVEAGRGHELSRELLGEGGRRLIEPMPGYAVFVALVKGWLGERAGDLYHELVCGSSDKHPVWLPPERKGRARLASLGRRFQHSPAKIALVTASIAYEAHAVVKEVFSVMREQVAEWPLPKSERRKLIELFGDHTAVYDGFVNAGDSSEARLKPHRDLYSIALYQMSIPKHDYCRCVGIEDTEPGIIALRAAGVGCAVALPNRDTSGQDYRAASRVIRGGLPELILGHNLLLREE